MNLQRETSLQFRAAKAAIAVLGTLWAAAALASGGEQTCSAHDGCFQFNVHGYYVINFIVFVAVIVWFGKKPLAEALDKRYRDVAKEIETAQLAKAEAEALLADYEAKMARLSEDNARLLAEVRTGTDVEVQSILADARTQVERMTAEIKLRLEQESKRIRDQLKDETAQMALRLAEEIVRKRMTAGAHAQLIDAALADLEALPAVTSTMGVA